MKRLEKLLDDAHYEQNSLILELTESSLLGIKEQQLLLPAIRNLGVQIAMDDFGTGYSNVGYLRNFLIDYVKIDKTFVSAICHNLQDAALVKAIIAMANSLGAISVAEGVEVPSQAQFLREAGCDWMQGYLYGPPLDSDAIVELSRADWDLTLFNPVTTPTT